MTLLTIETTRNPAIRSFPSSQDPPKFPTFKIPNPTKKHQTKPLSLSSASTFKILQLSQHYPDLGIRPRPTTRTKESGSRDRIATIPARKRDDRIPPPKPNLEFTELHCHLLLMMAKGGKGLVVLYFATQLQNRVSHLGPHALGRGGSSFNLASFVWENHHAAIGGERW
jgi:hypothetical protein